MKYEQINVGDRAEIHHEVTDSDVKKFIELSGDDNKIHIDKEFASNTYLKKPVAHGMIGASFISTIIGTKIPGDGALWMSQQLDFLRPVRVGDILTVIAEVTKKFDRDEMIEIKTDILNQHHELCTTGKAKVKVIKTEAIRPVETHKQKDGFVLVVGGSGGIGSECCKQLAAHGYDVMVHCHSNEEKARIVASEVEKLGRKAVIVKGDFSNTDSIHAISETIQRKAANLVGIVFAPAARLMPMATLATPWKEFEKLIDINLKGFHSLCQEVLPAMCERRYGKIVVVSTQAADQPVMKWAHYVAAKTALVGYAKALALEVAPLGVRINLVSPGMVDTELLADTPLKARLLAEASNPLRRLARPEDVANVVRFLISPDSDYLAGETIRVNGGQVML